mgnify:CR=1 FL=1
MSETLNAQDIAKKLQEQLTSLSATVDTHEVSTVDEVGDGIARVTGLKSAMAGELLEFKSSDTGETVFGLAQNLDRDEVGAVLFGAVDSIKEGDECRTTGRIMDIPVSRAMLGRVVNPLGQPIDGLGDIVATHRRPIEFKAPGVIDRTPVCEPVQTGLLAIDSMVPIGRGQRELIIGDRKTGKTAIAIDAILNQRGKGMVCIYVAIGQKASTLPTSARPSLSTVRSSTPSSFRQPLPIPPLCSTSRLWPVPLSASSSCTTARTASPPARPTPAATCSSSTTTCPSRLWPTVRCR